jgi:hypothetical protein
MTLQPENKYEKAAEVLAQMTGKPVEEFEAENKNTRL